MYLQSLRLQNLLSFGPDAEAITFGPLSVIIGPNGSGKSNLLEAIGLLAEAPHSLSDAIREGGGVGEWLWKGNKGKTTARIEAVVHFEVEDVSVPALKYSLAFSQVSQRLEIVDERIEEAAPAPGAEPVLYFGYVNDRPHIRLQGSLKEISSKELKATESILSQRQDPDVYPEMYYGLAGFFGISLLYRGWSFGRHNPARMPQPADLLTEFLMPGAENLGLMLNQIRKNPEAKEALLKHLKLVYEGVRDVDVSIVGGTVQVFIQENKWVVPANRLSDGTLRWLSLLTILLNPQPQALVCIEEPEMGLHPDLLPPLAGLLKEASQRMQLIVTTHSDALVDALSR